MRPLDQFTARASQNRQAAPIIFGAAKLLA